MCGIASRCNRMKPQTYHKDSIARRKAMVHSMSYWGALCRTTGVYRSNYRKLKLSVLLKKHSQAECTVPHMYFTYIERTQSASFVFYSRDACAFEAENCTFRIFITYCKSLFQHLPRFRFLLRDILSPTHTHIRTHEHMYSLEERIVQDYCPAQKMSDYANAFKNDTYGVFCIVFLPLTLIVFFRVAMLRVDTRRHGVVDCTKHRGCRVRNPPRPRGANATAKRSGRPPQVLARMQPANDSVRGRWQSRRAKHFTVAVLRQTDRSEH